MHPLDLYDGLVTFIYFLRFFYSIQRFGETNVTNLRENKRDLDTFPIIILIRSQNKMTSNTGKKPLHKFAVYFLPIQKNPIKISRQIRNIQAELIQFNIIMNFSLSFDRANRETNIAFIQRKPRC